MNATRTAGTLAAIVLFVMARPLPAAESASSGVVGARPAGDAGSSPAEDCRWSTGFGQGSVDGPVYALSLLPSSPGTLVVGGAFQHAGGLAASNVALLDGEVWSAMGAGLAEPVRMLTLYNGNVVAGGDFEISQWEESQGWRRLGTPLPSGLRALTTWSGNLVAAGGNRGVVTWTPATGWKQVSEPFPFAGSVNALADFGGVLAAAGDTRIALWYGSGWQTFSAEFPPTQDLPGLMALAVYQYSIVAAGSFAWSDSVRYIVRWDGTQWRPLGQGVSGPVRGLGVVNGMLYAMGDFPGDGGQETNHLAVWDGISWRSLDSSMNDRVHAVAAIGERLYAGGAFSPAAAIPAYYLAYREDDSWHGMGRNLDAEVSAFLDCDSVLVAGGAFERAGAIFGHHIAAWDGTDWRPLGEGFDDRVWALARHEGRVIAGGAFRASGAEPVQRVAAWDGSRWESLGDGMDLPVFSLLSASDGTLYAAGAFTRSGDHPLSHVARWSGSVWEPLGDGCDDWVTALAEWNGRIYAAGFFERAGDSTASRIAEWDGSRWRAIAGEMERTSSIRALAVYKGELVAAGRFGRIGDVPVTNLAAWDGQRWHSPAGSDPMSTSSGPILAIHAVGSLLFAGGEGLKSAGGWGGRMGMYDESWHSVGSVGGLGSVVTAFGDWRGHLFVGGTFWTGPCGPSHYIAEWFDLGARVPVTLLSFTADRVGDEAVIRWTLASDDVDIAGFRVFRQEPGGERFALSQELLSSSTKYEVRDPAPPQGETSYWLLAQTRTGETEWYGPAILPVWEPPQLKLVLEQNSPNPVITTTTFRFAVASPGQVILRVFDVAGRVVATLLDARVNAGPHTLTWDTADGAGNPVARGVYFYRLDGPSGFKVRRLLVLR